MRKYIHIVALALVAGALIWPVCASAKDNASTAPVTHGGKKWRIGYYEGGGYINYPVNLRTIVDGLAALGWLTPIQIPEMADPSQSKPVWDYLVSHVKSDYLEFAADGYWSAGWCEERRVETRQAIIRQLKEGSHIDFMIAMGTWAGQDLANNEHHTPTMAVSVSDPVRAGISATMNDSGLDHFHAKCDPTRYIRQLRLFHRFVKFKRLGVVYENSREGKTYAALEDIQTVAAERGFKVVTCEAPFARVDPDTAVDGVVCCHEQLATQVDAVYVTVHRGIVFKRMAEIVAPLLAHKIPTWSQRGPEEVKRGVLFSISRGGFKAVGRYHAEVMARVFNGERPRSISQIFEDPKLIAVNLKVAELIDFHVPNSVLRIADLIYERIEE